MDKFALNKNEEHIITIDDIGTNGEGIGHVDGYALFVKGALPGEKVRVRLMKLKKNFGFARLLEILEPSAQRVEPRCASFGPCGGCTLQHLSYEGQLAFKEKKVKDCLTRIGGVDLSQVEWLPILGCQEEDQSASQSPEICAVDDFEGKDGKKEWCFYYRNKAQFPVRADENGNPVTGFFAGRSHRLIPATGCCIQHPQINEVVECVLEFMKKYRVSAYDEERHSGLVRHIYVRRGYHTGQVMVCLVINGTKLPHAEELIKILSAQKGMTSISLNVNKERTNVILGRKTTTIWGSDTIEDTIGGIRYRISPQSFYQVNPQQTEKLYAAARAFADLKGNETVWDLYCGIGTISLYLTQKLDAARGGRVIGVEIVPEAIENAKENARLNGIENAEFYCGAAEDVAEKLPQSADVVVVDPPRKGCDQKLLDTIVAMAPEKVVYVSCDPATLARDVKILQEKGYKMVKGQACDMFPQGGHVETICQLVRK